MLSTKHTQLHNQNFQRLIFEVSKIGMLLKAYVLGKTNVGMS